MAALVGMCGDARAQAGDAVTSSRDHYARGRALYLENQNQQALREFEAGFELVPRPEFLINMGLCHARLGHPREARDLFKKFLAAAPEGHKQRKNVEELLTKAEAELANLPPEPAAENHPVAPEATPSPAPAAAVLVAPSAPHNDEKPKSFARRHWWIFPVVGVVVVGVAVGLGVGLSRPGGCDGQKGLCVDASQ